MTPPLLVVQGGAGSGKSSVIECMSQHMEKILRSPGDNPNHPYILKCAFTGTAAANIKGTTLHSAFSFAFGNEFHSLSDNVRDERRTEFENLKVVIIDEFSMIKSDMLYQLDLRLKEIKMNMDIAFGGVSVILFGDILQLRPVQGSFIMEEPKHEMFLMTHLINSLWHRFDVILLRFNHRQGKDKMYADLLNRARIGEVLDEDINLLQSRVRHQNHPDIPTDALVVVCTNAEVNRINNEKLSLLPGKEIILNAFTYTKARSEIKGQSDVSGAICGTPLQNVLELKVGAKVMMTYNIDISDGLTNGAFGEVIGFKCDNNGKVKQIYVHFYDEECGKSRRKSFPSLQSEFPGKNVTPIERIEFQYSMSRKKDNASRNATAIQFPLKLAFAATAHKVQGQTIKKPNYLVVDLRKVKEAAQAYVILSRVQSIDQLFIIGDACCEKIFASPTAMREVLRMTEVALNIKSSIKNVMISCNIRLLSNNFSKLCRSSL